MLELEIEIDREGFELEIDLSTESERVGLVGPSGSGKTTLLRIVAGLEDCAAARVVFHDEIWETPETVRVPTWRREIGWLPQDFLVFPHLDARGNLAYADPPRADLERVAEALELEDRLETDARALSGGERQRVALGRALLSDPKLLALDEPFAALDSRLTDVAVSLIEEWCDERECALLFAAHSEETAAPLVDELYRLPEGRLAE